MRQENGWVKAQMDRLGSHFDEGNGMAALFGAASRHIGASGRILADFLYPPQCIGCRGAVAEQGGLCATCWRSLSFIERPYCERLGTPFHFDLGPGLISPQAMGDPPVFERARSVVLYEGLGRALVHRLKYGDRLDLAPVLARLMARAGRQILVKDALIIPVPLHWTRLLYRRFNQAALLARHISHLSGVAADPHILYRRKRTLPQSGLSRSERQLNLQGALRVREEALARIAQKRIVLVDDVMTTSATANAAARALMQSGAGSVDVLSFARVVNTV
jgi:ComF family protein